MRTKLYSLMAWMACLLMASCTNQEMIEQASKPVHSNTLNVLTEKQESRSVLSYEGTFYWTENDYIGVYGAETENARFHFTSQADGVSTFTGNMNASEEKVSWAYFPYSEKVDVNKKQMSFPMPAERTVSNENHSPMIGRVEANNTVRFYHTGGILHLKIVGLPEHAAQLVITSEGENSPCLAGTAVIDDITADGCTYRIDNGSKEVVYDVHNLEGGEYVYSIYVPLQIGTYEKIKVTLKNEVGGTIKERSLSDLIVTRGKMTDTPTLHFSELLYGYEIPNEYIKDTEWNNAFIFSNQLFVGCKGEQGSGIKYTICNIFDLYNEMDNVIVVHFDDLGYIKDIIVDKNSIFFNYKSNNKVDIALLSEEGVKEYTDLSMDPIRSRAVEGGGICESLATITGWLGTFTSIPGFKNSELIGKISNILAVPSGTSWIDDSNVRLLLSGSLSFLAVGVTLLAAPSAGFFVAASVIYGIMAGTFSYLAIAENAAANHIYKMICGNVVVETIPPQRVDDYYFKAGYVLENIETMPKLSNKLPDWLGICQESGLIMRWVEVGKRKPDLDVRYSKDLEKDLTMLKIESSTPIEDEFSYHGGRTYYMRSYVQASSVYPIVYYGNTESITFDAYIKDVSVTSGIYSDGKIDFYIDVVGSCYDNTTAWSMNLYKDNKLFDSKVWTKDMNNITFLVEVDRDKMDYNNKHNWTLWEVGVTSSSDTNNEPISTEFIGFLEYKEDPQIDLDVQIIDGPRKISNSRASDDDDEEKYYVKYQVTAKTEGSGWIEQVKINVDGRPMKTGHPKNEGESFTYTGSKTYKNKSELPTISCEGILINGAGNIQSVPTSINVATKVR